MINSGVSDLNFVLLDCVKIANDLAICVAIKKWQKSKSYLPTM